MYDRREKGNNLLVALKDPSTRSKRCVREPASDARGRVAQTPSPSLGASARLRIMASRADEPTRSPEPWHYCAMPSDTTRPPQDCVFCAIAAQQAAASVVYEDETVVAFMDLNPVTAGHLLVVPRKHAMGLEDLDATTSTHAWSVGHDLARALRRSALGPEGINILLCDGEVAFQTVFHFHLHVIPRYAGDGWTIVPETAQRDRDLLDSDARVIKAAMS